MTTILIIFATCVLPLTLALVGWASSRTASDKSSPKTLKRAIAAQVLVFGVLYFGLSFWAWAAYAAPPQDTAAEAVRVGLSLGDGLGMLGVALATGLSVLGAGYAVGLVGSAALGVIAEKPELFGRTLVFIGLAEGLAIYGLVLSILILGRLG